MFGNLTETVRRTHRNCQKNLPEASKTKMEVFIERFWLDLAEEFYPSFKTTKNGNYQLPSGPGLGMDFNPLLINKFKV